MKNYITNLSTSRAAMVIGVAFIISVIFVTLVDDFLLANFVIPGDNNVLANDIEANGRLFGFAVVGYLIVLALDSIIGLALYVVLKPANKNLACLTSVLRILYACTLAIGLFALVFQMIDVYGYASFKLIGYIFFGLHILVLGYAVFKSGYIPKTLGVLLMLASLTYVLFFVDVHLPKSLATITMLVMAIAELSLSIWLILRRKELP